MANINHVLQTEKIENLPLEPMLLRKVIALNYDDLSKLYTKVLFWKLNNENLIDGLTQREMKELSDSFINLTNNSGNQNKPTISVIDRNNFSFAGYQSLGVLEKKYRDLLKSVILVSEAIERKEEIDEIATEFRKIFYDQNRSLNKTLHVIEQNFPATMAVFMVGTGLYNDQRGYWEAITNQFNVNGIQAHTDPYRKRFDCCSGCYNRANHTNQLKAITLMAHLIFNWLWNFRRESLNVLCDLRRGFFRLQFRDSRKSGFDLVR